jgi:hypothetical protein
MMRFLSLFLAVIAASATHASAAIRTCQPHVSSEVISAPAELEAKKLAIAQWQKLALKYGPNYDVWRLAAEKSLKCFAKGAAFECVAFGAPCIIQQNPNQQPSRKDGKGVPL